MSKGVGKVVEIGVGAQEREQVAKALSGFLASTYTLYLKTQNFHWNVTGEHFVSLHSLFEEQYTELRDAIDELAERIRALGHVSPGSFREFTALSVIEEEEVQPVDAMAMVKALLHNHEQASQEARKVLEVAEAVSDEVTVDMMIERMTIHDKTAWMLRSILL